MADARYIGNPDNYVNPSEGTGLSVLGVSRDRFGKLPHRHPGFLCAMVLAGVWHRVGGLGMTEAVVTEVGPERVPMPDSEVWYLARLALPQPDGETLRRLIAKVPWRAEEVVMWGRKVPQPRLTAWYGDAGSDYAYSGIRLQPLAWTPLLRDIKTRVEAAAGSTFNSVLLNYYRDNRDSIGFHSDDEPELGAQPVIASLSLGAKRAFILKHKASKHIPPVHLRLASGSLLLMRGDTQHRWKHGISKETRPCGPRVNLTFRRIVR
jgi:alkylated DNA repair dioxygenase AlkB